MMALMVSDILRNTLMDFKILSFRKSLNYELARIKDEVIKESSNTIFAIQDIIYLEIHIFISLDVTFSC